MTHPSANEPTGKGTSFLLWLLLLLVVLILALVLSDYGGARQFGQKAYSNALQISEKVARTARSLYTCGIQGCPETTTGNKESTTLAANSQQPNTEPAAPAIPAPAGDEPPAPAAEAQGNMPTEQAPGAINYPQYPAYPDQPSSSSQFNQESGAPFMPPSEPAYEAPADAAPMMPPPQFAQDYLPPPMMPPMQQPMPANPEFPAFVQHPPGMNPPMMPPQAVKQMPDHPDTDTGHGAENNPLNRARGAAQAGYLRESVREYLYYLTIYPDDIDAYGELGNVYLKMGRYPEAAQNFYEAATRLIEAGHFSAVRPMMQIIEIHEPMLASLLNKRMANATRDNQDPRR